MCTSTDFAFMHTGIKIAILISCSAIKVLSSGGRGESSPKNV